MTTYAHATRTECGRYVGHVTADAGGLIVLWTTPLLWDSEEEAEAAAVWGWCSSRRERYESEAA